MPRRRHRRGLYERLASHNDSMSPGTIGGRVSSAAPVMSASDVLAEQAGDIGVVAMSEGESWQDDQFTASGDGAQDVSLTYLPISDHHMSVFVRELRRRRDIDWTRDGQVVSLLAAPDVRDGDPVDVWYAYRSGAPVAPAEPLALDVPYGSSGWKAMVGVYDPAMSDPDYDDSAWISATGRMFTTGAPTFGAFTDGGTAVAGSTAANVTNVGTVVTGVGGVADPSGNGLLVRREFPAGTAITMKYDESAYFSAYIDGVLSASRATGNRAAGLVLNNVTKTAPWVFVGFTYNGNGHAYDSCDFEVTGTET